MVFNLSGAALEAAIEEALKESDKVYPAIGLFTRWFNSVELQITRLLAHILDMRDFEKFEVLARGLLPKQKVKLLIRASKTYAPLDQVLIDALTHFEKRCIKLRNHISHSDAMPEGDRIHFGSIAEMPAYAPDETRPSGRSPSWYQTSDIFKEALWLREFYHDLDVACVQTWNGQAIQIDRPRCTVPQRSD